MRIIFFCFCILCLFNSTAFAQTEHSIIHIQSFSSDSTLLNKGTGFSIDGAGIFAHGLLFKSAAFAQVHTRESTFIQITEISGIHPSTGLVRIEIEAGQEGNIPGFQPSNGLSEEGDVLEIITASENGSVSRSPCIIQRKMDLIGYGEAYTTEKELDPALIGSPMIDHVGAVEGVVIALDANGASTFIAKISFVNELQSLSTTIADFGKKLDIKTSIMQGIKAYLSDDVEAAASAFEQTKQETPGNLTAHYYSGLIYYEQGLYSAARWEFEKALELQVDLPEAHFMVGKIDYHNQEYQTSRSSLDMAEAFKFTQLPLYELRGKAKCHLKVQSLILPGRRR